MSYSRIMQFIFSFTYRKYQSWGEKDIPGVYALCIISTIQILNTLTLLLIALILNIIKADVITKNYVVIFSVLVLFINYYYLYRLKGRDLIIKTFNNTDPTLSAVRKAALIYIIITIILFLSCFTYYLYS